MNICHFMLCFEFHCTMDVCHFKLCLELHYIFVYDFPTKYKLIFPDSMYSWVYQMRQNGFVAHASALSVCVSSVVIDFTSYYEYVSSFCWMILCLPAPQTLLWFTHAPLLILSLWWSISMRHCRLCRPCRQWNGDPRAYCLHITAECDIPSGLTMTPICLA